VTEFNEEELLASLYLNLKGPKKKHGNWMDIAEDCKKLKEYYGSAKKVADRIGVSYELIRALLTLLTLPEEVQTLIRDDKILFDVGQRIARIKGKERQIEVAKTIARLPAHDARDILQYAKKYPEAQLGDFKTRVTQGKDSIEKVHIALVPLREDIYETLKMEGQQKKLSVEKTILLILKQWVDLRNKEGVH